MSLVKGSSETGMFRHLYNHVFTSPQVRKYISDQDHPFFENVQKFSSDFESAEKY